jgi:hypothetical protein
MSIYSYTPAEAEALARRNVDNQARAQAEAQALEQRRHNDLVVRIRRVGSLHEVDAETLTVLDVASVATADGAIWQIHRVGPFSDPGLLAQAVHSTRWTIGTDRGGWPECWLLARTDETVADRQAAATARADQIAATERDRRAFLRSRPYAPVTVGDVLGLSVASAGYDFTLAGAARLLAYYEADVAVSSGKVTVSLSGGLGLNERAKCIHAAATLAAAAEVVAKHRGDWSTLPDRHVGLGGNLV